MIDYISGTIADLSPTWAVVDNHGIGYGLEISLQTYEALQGKQQVKVFVLTTINQRDATEVMYGFATKDERELFNLIIGISGIGAASARMILSSMTADEFREAILSENINRIKSVKGIGLKSAQRMILELKDKISSESVSGSVSADVSAFSAMPAGGSSDTVTEALEALMVLGYTQGEVAPILGKLDPSLSTQDLIKETLRLITARNSR